MTFFKSYTEKVWGISCSKLKDEWAAQRIKDLSLKTALLNMFLKPKQTIKTLIEEFDYPRLGPGMMWKAVKEEVERRDGLVRLNCDVVRIDRTGNRIDGVVVSSNGQEEMVHGTQFISSMPVTEFIHKLDPPPPSEVLQASKKLTYRDFLTVCLIVNKPELFPDNWIYVHDDNVKVGRIQNFKRWSPDMVPDLTKTSLGLEYFCSEGDALWNTPDADLVKLGKRAVDRIGLANYADIEDGCVFRVPKAYPVYDSDYRDHLAEIRGFVDGLENFQTIGRNGLHRYNNQDHAMLTGMLAVRNVVLGQNNDLWTVNAEQEYHEEVRTERRSEEEQAIETVEAVLTRLVLKLDKTAFGMATGATLGVLLFLMTMWLVLKGGDVVGPRLELLSHYFPGYGVTTQGSIVGLAYGFLCGFVGGWAFAFFRNTGWFLSMALMHRRAERSLLRKLLEYL
jgi:protoporphyrinogen oxidase